MQTLFRDGVGYLVNITFETSSYYLAKVKWDVKLVH